MAKHGANCPKCGHRVDFDTAVGDTVACPGCQAALRVPGNPPDGGTPIPTPESLMATEGGAPPPPGPDDPLIGTCLDEFEIRGRLGEGGMGVVYEAWQPSLERSVAIKVLPRSISSDQRFIDRFVREARAAAAITHANIIEVHAIGNGYDHQYIAMELVEGGSLADVIRLDGPLPAERALDVMKQVASALAAAHGCGILHRDIKPSNILFTKRGRVKVADFGLAKHQGVDVTVTRTGQMLGTPLYIPPEAARGQPLDARSDLYSLGATFYHALAGRPPFAASTSVALAFQHAQAEVPSLRDAAPNVPQALCHIIHRLLAKNPDERYADACTLLEALEHVEVPSSQEAPTATEPGLLRDRRRRTGKSLAGEVARGGRTATRRKGLLIGGILGLIALISVLVAVLGSRGDRSSQAPDSPPATTSTPPGQPAALRTIRFRRLKPRAPEDDVEWDEWVSLFDGKTLRDWRQVEQIPNPAGPRSGNGKVAVDRGQIILEPGATLAGISSLRDFAMLNYELEAEAMRLEEKGGLCTIAFRAAGLYSSFVCGDGDAGTVVGLDRVDGQGAGSNVTTKQMSFRTGQWYRLRLRVSDERIVAWVDEDKVLDIDTEGHVFARRLSEAQIGRVGIYSRRAKVALRGVRLRLVKAQPADSSLPRLEGEGWESLFDGQTLDGWRAATGQLYGGPEAVRVRDGRVELVGTVKQTNAGIVCARSFPTDDYEVAFDAMRLAGKQTGCAAVTAVFPVGKGSCAVEVGAYDTTFAGLFSSWGASAKRLTLEDERWYRVRLRVTRGRVEIWLGQQKVGELSRRTQPSRARGLQNDPLKPFGIRANNTTTALRNIRLRRLKPEPAPDGVGSTCPPTSP